MRRTRLCKSIVCMGIIAGVICPDGCAQSGGAEESKPVRRIGGNVIGPEDTITITALNIDEISDSWRIGSLGDITLPIVGKVQAGGLTVEQFEAELKAKLKRFVLEPEVYVYISEFRSQPVTVTGPVEKPGTMQLQGSKTLFDVLVRAGPNEAGPTLTLMREVARGSIPHPGARDVPGGQYSILELNLKDVMTGRGEAANIAVLPYDIITVSVPKPQRFVHISGEVVKPGSVELVTHDSISLMKVVAVAGGLTRVAKGKSMIMHINPEGIQTSVAVVDIKQIAQGKAKDLELTAGDVVVVPSSELKSFVQTISTAAISPAIYTLLYRF
jgi:polysaccharide export outer membrane protein